MKYRLNNLILSTKSTFMQSYSYDRNAMLKKIVVFIRYFNHFVDVIKTIYSFKSLLDVLEENIFLMKVVYNKKCSFHLILLLNSKY